MPTQTGNIGHPRRYLKRGNDVEMPAAQHLSAETVERLGQQFLLAGLHSGKYLKGGGRLRECNELAIGWEWHSHREPGLIGGVRMGVSQAGCRIARGCLVTGKLAGSVSETLPPLHCFGRLAVPVAPLKSLFGKFGGETKVSWIFASN